MRTETEHKDLKYTHPATKHEIMYRLKGECYEYLISKKRYYNHAFVGPWIKSGMKRGFVLIKGKL